MSSTWQRTNASPGSQSQHKPRLAWSPAFDVACPRALSHPQGLSTRFSLTALIRGSVRTVKLYTATFLHPFAPPELPGFFATMDALTPARPALRPHSRAMNTGLCRAGLPVSRVWPSEHSAPNHLARSWSRFNTQPLSGSGFQRRSGRRWFWASLLSSKLATRPGRNGFVILRTARSPPVAPHLASRRRSYVQLQAGVCIPEENLHLSDQTRLQAHWTSRSA